MHQTFYEHGGGTDAAPTATAVKAVVHAVSRECEVLLDTIVSCMAEANPLRHQAERQPLEEVMWALQHMELFQFPVSAGTAALRATFPTNPKP